MARATGDSVTWVRAVAGRDRAGGPEAPGDRRHANPGAAPLLGAAQPEALRAALAGPAPDGGLRTGRKAAAGMGRLRDRPVAERRGREWVRRLGVTPQRPRPAETRADPAARAASKGGGSPR